MARSLCAVAIAAFLSQQIEAADWPAIHGDMDHTGVGPAPLQVPLAPAWILQADQPPSPAFTANLADKKKGDFDAISQDYVFHPVIEGRRLAFGSTTEEAVYCLDTATGATSWKVYLDGAIRMAPVWHTGKLLVGTDGGSVYCLDGASGRELWRYRTGPKRHACVGNQRIVSSWPVRGGVIVNQGIAYFAAGVYPPLGCYLYAVNADTGALVWERPIQISPNGCLRVVDGDKLWVASGGVAPAQYRLADGEPAIPDPDRRGGRGGWWLGNVCGIPATGPSDDDMILFRLSPDKPPGKWRNSSANQTNTLPPGIYSGVHGLCALGADTFFLLRPDNTVLAVPQAAFREACAKRVEEIKSMQSWDYGWVMAADLREDGPFAEALQKSAAWTAKLPDEKGAFFKWGIVAGAHLFLGGNNRVLALDASTGAVAWSEKVEGDARGLAAADSALFVSTDRGRIYCFRQGATTPGTHSPSFSEPYAENKVCQEAARIAVASADRKRGYCVVMGVGDGELAYRIAKQSEFFVVGLDKDPAKVAAARGKLARAGVYGTRVAVYHQPDDPPAFARRFANLVVSDSAIAEGKVPYAPESVLGLVQPYSGTVVLGSPKGMEVSGKWTHPQFTGWKTVKGESGTAWQTARRGPLPGAGEWTGLYADPSNTVCSGDTLVSTNLQIQWFGPPGMADMVERHSMSMSPLVKNGILYRMGAFMPTQNNATSLTALDAYNGTQLWTTQLPHSGRRNAGHNTHSYACIGDGLFAASGNQCIGFDGVSGKKIRTFEGVREGCDWGYVGGWQHYLIGTSQGADVDLEKNKVRDWDKKGFTSRPASSRDLFAHDLRSGQRLWTYTGGAILNVSITGDLGHDTIYFVESRNAAALNDRTGQIEFSALLAREGDGGARIVALDLKTGQERWSQPITRNVDARQAWIMYLTYADGVLLASRTYFKQEVGGKDLYGYDFEALDTRAAGQSLWQKWLPAPEGPATWKNPLHSHPFYARNQFYFMARYYGAVYSFDPRTGKETVDTSFGRGWEQEEAKSCTTPAASASAFYFRRNSHFLYDLETKKIQDLTRVSRPACWMSMIPAGGLITMLEQSTGCQCGFAMRLSVAFASETDAAGL